MNEDKYSIHRWGEGFFEVNPEGNVTVRPNKTGNGGDLHTLVQTLVERGIEAPILLRFNGIIRHRLAQIYDAFDSAIEEYDYRNKYRLAFPVKVNPQRHVVETVAQSGKDRLVGLEVGSKPELIAVMAMDTDPELLMLCNGYKDADYISLALLASKLGKETIIIIEQAYELKLVLKIAEELKIEPKLGFRMKLTNKGTGQWQSSSGERSKFGLFSHEIHSCIEQLKAKNKTHWLKLLHFHIGSQITSIESIKRALNEGARMYTELAKDHPSLSYFDVGGGLAIDYDGTRSTNFSSKNYTLDEYARCVVYAIGEACLEANVPDPVIITESGRAIVAHHSVLIVEVLDVTTAPKHLDNEPPPSNNYLITELLEMFEELTTEHSRETFHDLMELKEHILEEFIYGQLSFKERAYAEKLYWILLHEIRKHLRQLPDATEDLHTIDQILQEMYFCNFSVFQSLPDSWAIGQLFPIMPIHRLLEPLHDHAILADLSCDSDGKIDTFIGRKGPQKVLDLHHFKEEEPYYLGIFLVGAYQEILGGLHNLFGDTNAVHVELNDKGEWEVLSLVEGDTIEEVLGVVQYTPEKMLTQLHDLIERRLQHSDLTPAESAKLKKKFKSALESYTYLVV